MNIAYLNQLLKIANKDRHLLDPSDFDPAIEFVKADPAATQAQRDDMVHNLTIMKGTIEKHVELTKHLRHLRRYDAGLPVPDEELLPAIGYLEVIIAMGAGSPLETEVRNMLEKAKHNPN